MSQHSHAPLRLLVISARFFPESGGIETHVYQTSRRLVARGVDVTVLTTDRSGDLASEVWIEGIRVLRVPAYPRSSDWHIAPRLSMLIKAGAWDLVHCQGYHTAVPPLAMWAAHRAGVPYLLTFHGGGHSSRLRNAVRGLQRQALKPAFVRAAKLIATARFEYELFGDRLGIPRDRFVYMPNGADVLQLATPPPREAGLIASIGRLEQYKGHHRVLAALPEVLRTRPHARLWIMGEGPYAAELIRQSNALNVASQVTVQVVPPGDRTAMARALAQVQVMALLSAYETHPMAAIEAAAAGCQVLVAATSGLQELAADGLATAIPLDASSATIANQLVQLLDAPPPGCQRVKVSSWDDCTDQLHDLYQQIVYSRLDQCVF